MMDIASKSLVLEKSSNKSRKKNVGKIKSKSKALSNLSYGTVGYG